MGAVNPVLGKYADKRCPGFVERLQASEGGRAIIDGASGVLDIDEKPVRKEDLGRYCEDKKVHLNPFQMAKKGNVEFYLMSHELSHAGQNKRGVPMNQEQLDKFTQGRKLSGEQFSAFCVAVEIDATVKGLVATLTSNPSKDELADTNKMLSYTLGKDLDSYRKDYDASPDKKQAQQKLARTLFKDISDYAIENNLYKTHLDFNHPDVQKTLYLCHDKDTYGDKDSFIKDVNANFKQAGEVRKQNLKTEAQMQAYKNLPEQAKALRKGNMPDIKAADLQTLKFVQTKQNKR